MSVPNISKVGMFMPKNDVVFFALFSAKNKNLVKSLISSILKKNIVEIDMDKSTSILQR